MLERKLNQCCGDALNFENVEGKSERTDTVKSGPDTVLSEVEEAKLCAHLKALAEVGYEYTRATTVTLASNYAVALGKRSVDSSFSLKWLYGFMGR